jgi:hypothetical protein
MNQEQLTQFEEALCQAADKLLAEGGKIISGIFGVRHGGKSCCPIGAMVRDLHFSATDTYHTKIRDLGFDLSEKEMWEFIRGFDNPNDKPNWQPNSNFPMEMMGHRLAKKYLG